MGSAASRGDAQFLQACAAGNVKFLLGKVELLSAKQLEAVVNSEHDDNRMYGLHLASEGGHDAVVDLLMRHGADPFKRTVRGNTPLHIAARSSQAGCVRALLRGTNQDMWERARLLWVALRKPNDGCALSCLPRDMVRLLTSHLMRDCPSTNKLVNAENDGGSVALKLAIKSRATAVIPLLLSQGSLKCLKGGALGSALHVAAANGVGEQAVRMLAREAGHVNDLNERNETPLFRACCAYPEAEETVCVLLELGADWTIKATSGKTAYDEADARHYRKSCEAIMRFATAAKTRSK